MPHRGAESIRSGTATHRPEWGAYSGENEGTAKRDGASKALHLNYTNSNCPHPAEAWLSAWQANMQHLFKCRENALPVGETPPKCVWHFAHSRLAPGCLQAHDGLGPKIWQTELGARTHVKIAACQTLPWCTILASTATGGLPLARYLSEQKPPRA